MNSPRARAAVLAALVPLLAAAAAALALGRGSAGAAWGQTVVVATTTQAADLARHVAGPRGRVVGVLAANADPHEYELRPRDMKALVRADVVVRSGGDVDAWLADALEGAGSDAPVVTLLDHAVPLRTPEGVDPHWWQDPRNAIRAVAAIRGALAAADPAHSGAYRRAARRYAGRLRALDRAVAGCLARLAPDERRLVTTHDALGYYARRYGLRVIGTVIPSLSTAGQPSAGAVSALLRTIRATGVRAIFAEQSVAPRVEQAIAREAGASVGALLWADALGPPGSDGATYVGAISANTRALVAGLSGGRHRCRLPEGS